MVKAAIEKAKQYGDKVLIALLILIGIFYTCLAALPKHGDFYTINYISKSFAAYGFHFLDIMVPKMSSAIAYPPTYYILQGYWIKLGSLIFNYDLSTWAINSGSVPGVYPLWGMVTNFTCLFIFTAISYFTLKNKWLSLLSFGTLSFVSVIVMGQIDIFGALFVYISLLLMLKAYNAEKYLHLIFLGVVSLGISTQFKTYGAILLPLYIVYAFSILKRKNMPQTRIYGVIAIMALTFISSFFIVWVPFAKWFGIIILSGESNWLFNLQIFPVDLPLNHTVSIWLLGYAIILFDSLRNALKAKLNERYFIFYGFAIIAWFFATVYTHPQWWLLLLPSVLLVMDNFRGKVNYLLCLSLFTLFLFYPMMWVYNIDNVLAHYIPIIPIFGEYATILSTTIVALLIIWILEIMAELKDSDDGNVERSWADSTAPVLILAVPFLFVFLIATPFILSVGAAGVKSVEYNMAIGPLYGNITAGQSFTSPRDDLEGINMRFTYNKSPTKGVIFHLSRDPYSPDLVTETIDPAVINDKQYTRITFPGIEDSDDQRYYFFVESPDSSPDNAVSVLCNDDEDYDGGAAYMNGTPIDLDMSFETVHKSSISDILTVYY